MEWNQFSFKVFFFFLNVFFCQFWFMPRMTKLFYTATGRHVILYCWAQVPAEKKKSDRNGHHWVNSYLFILLGHIKSLYPNGIENAIERPWPGEGFHGSLEDGTVSAVAERSICFWWWYSVLRSPCKSELLCFFGLFF